MILLAKIIKIRRSSGARQSRVVFWDTVDEYTASDWYCWVLDVQDADWCEVLDRKNKQTQQRKFSSAKISEVERKRREAVWELFKSECVFLIDHLMALKHVSHFPVLLDFSSKVHAAYFWKIHSWRLLVG